MRIELPHFDNNQDLLAYLYKNKAELIRQKKSLPVVTDPVMAGAILEGSDITVKAAPAGYETKPGSIVVDVIGNLSMWMDKHMDVMITDSWKKSITEKGSCIPFIEDHKWYAMSRIAKTMSVYAMDVELKKLGIKSDIKTAQAFMAKVEMHPEYDERAFNKYNNGMVDQHSIGLQYIQIDLAVNDPDMKNEYKVWQKYISQIINREEAEKAGFFWAVKEAKIYEISAVLFGANIMTPTVSVESSQKNSLEGGEPGTPTPRKEEPKHSQIWRELNNYSKPKS